MKIFKFKIEVINKIFEMQVPGDFYPLSFQSQKITEPLRRGEEIFLWAIVNPSSPLVYKKFLCVGTGIELPHEAFCSGKPCFDYIGTAQQESYVWHLFWEG